MGSVSGTGGRGPGGAGDRPEAADDGRPEAADDGRAEAADDGRPEAGVAAEFEARGIERLSLFSDAVIAIAITLLAIELPVPTGDTVSALWASIRHQDGHYVAFLISFLVIAASWADHHDLFRCLVRVDARLRTLNSSWLMMIVLNPFATRLLTAHGHPTTDAHALRFGFYALLQVLSATLLLAMLHHMRDRHQAPDTPAAVRIKLTYQSYVFMVGFGLSIPLFFATTYAWALWIALPLTLRQLHRLDPHIRRRLDRAGRAGRVRR
jgi:uncharacterized membrane protein